MMRHVAKRVWLCACVCVSDQYLNCQFRMIATQDQDTDQTHTHTQLCYASANKLITEHSYSESSFNNMKKETFCEHIHTHSDTNYS